MNDIFPVMVLLKFVNQIQHKIIRQNSKLIQRKLRFDAINKDFRYQLTAIGAPMPNLNIAEEIKDNHFIIAGGKAGEVSAPPAGARPESRAYSTAPRAKPGP